MSSENKTIQIKVTDKVATLVDPSQFIVCGNNDYEVEFLFDEQWAKHRFKTVLFVYEDTCVKRVIDGNVCAGVALAETSAVGIGVFSGDIITTTPAFVDCRISATDIAKDKTPVAPSEDVYNQIIETLNANYNKIMAEINARIPVPTEAVEGRYLQVINGEIAFSEQAFVPPKLYAPAISVKSREKTVEIEGNPSNGEFEARHKVYVDSKLVANNVVGSSYDFGEYVEDKIAANIGVTAIADGFLESKKTESRWGLTNGSETGIKYELLNDGTYTVSDVAVFRDADYNKNIVVASYVDGKEVTEVSNGTFEPRWEGTDLNEGRVVAARYDSIDFLCPIAAIGKAFRGSEIGRLYIPSVSGVDEAAFGKIRLGGWVLQDYYCEIQRLYSLENLPETIRNSVTDLSPDNGFRRINTWCTGIGNDGEFEWAYKPDNTVRVTYYMRETDVGYRDITIPDVIDGMPVNGLGKFFLYNNGYVTGVTFGDNMRDINDSAMRNCAKLASIKFGKGLESIGEHAFRYSAVTELNFSGSPKLSVIKGRAFGNCSKLTKVTMPSSITSIASTAFASCSALKDIYVPWGEGEVEGAPWGATNATIHYNSNI